MSFENKLIEKGYVKHVKDGNKYKIATDKDYLSSLGRLYFFYIKDKEVVIYGLLLHDKPPMLVHTDKKDIIDMYHADPRAVKNPFIYPYEL